ncbi:hypothetical protein DAI22_06g270100 [Oryza sativa Japonica Group]|uniref:Uncharacterized protein n=1 Tax=Oryza rufipogon TaxID=4529 RepID=A0A0E0Q280_ORYRU|nr:hypothetical protein DAI22_06g270100 [Oryza sativa Japonica Group]
MALMKNNSMMVLCLAVLVLMSATSISCHAPPARNSDGTICIYYPACTIEGCVIMCGKVVGANTGHCDNYGNCCCPNLTK